MFALVPVVSSNGVVANSDLIIEREKVKILEKDKKSLHLDIS
jgi:hypothetical protein